MSDTPLARLYLDIDGVLNAHAPQGWGKTETGYAIAEGHKYKIRWAPAMIEALKELPVEIVWTTTWRDDAPASIGPLLGLGESGRVLHPQLNPEAKTYWPTIDWKMEAVAMDQIASPFPFIHIDDEFWREDSKTSDSLILGPNPTTGIQPRHIDEIKEFLKGLTDDTV